MGYFAKNLWRKIWDRLTTFIGSECDVDGTSCNAEMRLKSLDKDKDGLISVEDIQAALAKIVGLSVDNRELSLAQFVHSFADTNGSGEVTLEDLETFCDEMEEIYEADAWRLSFPKSSPSQEELAEVST